jgi:ParB/RepB/Spo0J family partition protein
MTSTTAIGSGATPLEIRELERKYAALHIADPGRQSRLTASISAHGQQTPVVVVPQAPDRYVLIDGHARVAALEALTRDLVDALVWPVSEAQALVLSLRFEISRRRSALEEGWLLHELIEGHGQHPGDLALALQRSASWISRRLSLVRVVPEAVQAAVRRGQVPAQAAMKSLVPLARATGDGRLLAWGASGWSEIARVSAAGGDGLVRVRALTGFCIERGRDVYAGDLAEVSASEARRLIASGRVELAPPDPEAA